MHARIATADLPTQVELLGGQNDELRVGAPRVGSPPGSNLRLLLSRNTALSTPRPAGCGRSAVAIPDRLPEQVLVLQPRRRGRAVDCRPGGHGPAPHSTLRSGSARPAATRYSCGRCSPSVASRTRARTCRNTAPAAAPGTPAAPTYTGCSDPSRPPPSSPPPPHTPPASRPPAATRPGPRSYPRLTLRRALVRCIDRASGLFRHASRSTSRNDAPAVATRRSSSVTVS